MESPHWLMAIGALLVVFGFVGLALQRNVQVMFDPNRLNDQRAQPQAGLSNPPSVAAAS